MTPIVVFQGAAKAKPDGAVEELSTRVETRGVRLTVPGGPQVTVSATRENDGSWTEPGAQVPGGKLDYAMWQDLQRTVEKAFAEYAARFEDAKEGVEGVKKQRKKDTVAVPQSPGVHGLECKCGPFGTLMGLCPIHGVYRR